VGLEMYVQPTQNVWWKYRQKTARKKLSDEGPARVWRGPGLGKESGGDPGKHDCRSDCSSSSPAATMPICSLPFASRTRYGRRNTIGMEKGISQQLIAIAKRCDVYGTGSFLRFR